MTSENPSKSSPIQATTTLPPPSSSVPPKILPKPVHAKSKNEVNILLLGQTGVGKSTWINGLYNYFKYNSLKEAEQNPQFLIPFQFTMMDEDYNEILIKCSPSSSPSAKTTTVDRLLTSENFDSDSDDNDNNDDESGSPTHRTRLYQIKVDTKIVRLIDTPGFASSIAQDMKNFDNIMNHLKSGEKSIQKIHAILIFLKPNEARLDYKFQFSLRNLLTYLPRDAYKNLIFCFTNTRGNSFRPGETLTTLKTFFSQIFTSLGPSTVTMTLDKSTLYCFDSEAVRYLGARQWAQSCEKKLDCFGSEQLSSANLSWQASAAETRRLLDHISSSSASPPLEPISVKTIVVINEIQNLLHLLRGPIVDLCLVIQGNMQKAQNFLLANLKNDGQQQRQPFKQLETIRFVSLRRARTVCLSDDCPGQKLKSNNNSNSQPSPSPSPSHPRPPVALGNVNSGNNGVSILYPNVCHENCQIVNFGALGTPNVCDCFEGPDKKICKGCGCDYAKHTSVHFESHVLLEQDNAKALEAIGNDLVVQLSLENDEILRVGKTIRAFLEKHALVLYTDAITEYMEQRLQVEKEREKDKTKVGSRVEHFEKILKQYRNEIVINKEEEEGFKIESTKDILNMIEQLAKLPLMGNAIKSLVQEVKKLTMTTTTTAKTTPDRLGASREKQQLQQKMRDHIQGQSPQKEMEQQQQQSRNAVNPFDRVNGENGNRVPASSSPSNAIATRGMRKSFFRGLRPSRSPRANNHVNSSGLEPRYNSRGDGRNHHDCEIL